MEFCATCGVPMISSCPNVNCISGQKELQNRKKKSASQARIQKIPSPSRLKSKKRGPDLSKPIPPEVNSKEYVPNPKKSLLAYLGYSRAANQDKSMRRGCLSEIISAGPLIPSSGNQRYISSFGPPNSSKRIEQIIYTLKKQISGQWWVQKDPIKHAKKLPALEKASEDISWLESKIQTLETPSFNTILQQNLHKKISISYQSNSGEVTDRNIKPLEVYSFQGSEFVKAFCFLRLDERTFKVERILQTGK